MVAVCRLAPEVAGVVTPEGLIRAIGKDEDAGWSPITVVVRTIEAVIIGAAIGYAARIAAPIGVTGIVVGSARREHERGRADKWGKFPHRFSPHAHFAAIGGNASS
jgi:hypothetical protein